MCVYPGGKSRHAIMLSENNPQAGESNRAFYQTTSHHQVAVRFPRTAYPQNVLFLTSIILTSISSNNILMLTDATNKVRSLRLRVRRETTQSTVFVLKLWGWERIGELEPNPKRQEKIEFPISALTFSSFKKKSYIVKTNTGDMSANDSKVYGVRTRAGVSVAGACFPHHG